MYRTAILSTFMIVTAAVAVLPALAQSPVASQDVLRPQPSDSKSSGPSGLKEDFGQDPVTGWEFVSQHAFVSTGNGRALATKGAAFWDRAGEVGDFTMKIRYAYERGIALVDFRHARRYGTSDRYTLLLNASNVHLIRVSEIEEKELAQAPFPLPPQTWHDVIVQAAGGQINVWIDGTGVISVRDPQPLRSGMCALGVESGVVLFDQVLLIPQGQADQADLTSDPANWTLWSAASQTGRAVKPSAASDASSPPRTPSETTSSAAAAP